MKKYITQKQYIELHALVDYGTNLNKLLLEIQEILQKITGEEDELGHCCDASTGMISADELVKKLELTIKY